MVFGTIKMLKASEFFTFFNVHEVSSKKSGPGNVKTLQCKPGGFQEYIDISFNVDERENVLSACLLLDRSWIGTAEHVNPFANDIAKSFIDALVPGGDHAAIDPLLHAIMDAKGIGDKRIYLHDQPRDLNPNFNTIKALGVYLAMIPRHEIVMGSCVLKIENVPAGNRERLEIDLRPR